jgi:hypothetical protein
MTTVGTFPWNLVTDPMCGGWYFNDEAIRILRRIEYLRTNSFWTC